MASRKKSDLLPAHQPFASLDRFWQTSVERHPGGKVSTFLAYLTYVAWYVNEYEAGPSADWDEFRRWYHERNIDWTPDTDDTKWFTDVQIVRTLPFMLSTEETDSLCEELARTLTSDAKVRHFSVPRQ